MNGSRPSKKRLEECMQRIADAEAALASTRVLLKEQMSEDSRAAPVEPLNGHTKTKTQAGAITTTASTQKAGHCVAPPAGPNVKVAVAESEGQNGLAPVKPATVRSRTAALHAELEEIARVCSVKLADARRCKDIFDREATGGCISRNQLHELLEEACACPISKSEMKRVAGVHVHRNADCLRLDEFVGLFSDLGGLRTDGLGQNQEGIKKSVVSNYLLKEINEADACMQIPGVLILFIAFFFSVFFHFPMERLHGMDRSVLFDIRENANFAFSGITPLEMGRMGHKNFEDVNSFADFWSFFSLGLVPLFFPEGWDISEMRGNIAARCTSPRDALYNTGWPNSSLTTVSDKADDWACPLQDVDRPQRPSFFGSGASYLFYNAIIGGVRLRQQRVPIEPCFADKVGSESMRQAVYDGLCVDDPVMPFATEPGYDLAPELYQALQFEQHHESDEKPPVYFKSTMPQTEVLRALRQLENEVWLDPQTLRVEVMFTTYNPNTDILTATFLMLFFSRGGHIYKILEPTSITMHKYPHWVCYFFDVLWGVLVLKMFFQESVEVWKNVKQLGWRKGLYVYADPMNLVDWISMIYGLVLACLWFGHCLYVADVEDMMKSSTVGRAGNFETEEELELWFRRVSGAVRQSQTFRIMLAIYPFVICSRFFKAFSSQPRLALVTRTLSMAAKDILHFGVVFCVMMCLFATSAMILFGQELEQFTHFPRALFNTFMVLFGNFEWAEMVRIGRPWAYMWFFTFVILVNLIMLNMLLAIVMDVYTQVRGGINANAETIVSQSVEIVMRWRRIRMGQEISLKTVLDVLNPSWNDPGDDEDDVIPKEEEYITVESFCELVPKLQQEQAEEILLSAHRLDLSERNESTSLTEAAGMIKDMSEVITCVGEHMDEVFAAPRRVKTRRYLNPCDSLYTCNGDDDSTGSNEDSWFA